MTFATKELGLQWGHALSGMDMMLQDGVDLYPAMLQWGHAFSGMDTVQILRHDLLPVTASMGPCPFRHGYLPGPRRKARASVRLQWGHALSGMDIWPDQRAG